MKQFIILCSRIAFLEIACFLKYYWVGNLNRLWCHSSWLYTEVATLFLHKSVWGAQNRANGWPIGALAQFVYIEIPVHWSPDTKFSADSNISIIGYATSRYIGSKTSLNWGDAITKERPRATATYWTRHRMAWQQVVQSEFHLLVQICSGCQAKILRDKGLKNWINCMAL